MSTFPAPAMQIEAIRLEISELRSLQERHERWTRETDDTRLQKAHMRVASELEELVFGLENNLITALKKLENEGRR